MRILFLALCLGLALRGISSAGDFAIRMVEATFKLYHPSSTGTCFLVRGEGPEPGLFLCTAAHVLERTKGETAILVLRERKEDGSFKRHDHTIPVRKGDQPLWTRHASEDTAVLRLKEPLPLPVSPLPLSALADAKRLEAAGLGVCGSVFILTYPTRAEANKAGFPIARPGTIASHPMLPVEHYPTYKVSFTTFDGDSGGPVFVRGGEDHPLVAGIVLAQLRNDEKLTMKYEERTIHHPLGLGIVLHSSIVRDTLLQAAGSKPAPAK